MHGGIRPPRRVAGGVECQADCGVGSEVGRFSRRVEALLAEPGAKMAVLTTGGARVVTLSRRLGDPSEQNGTVATSASVSGMERSGRQGGESGRTLGRTVPRKPGGVAL